ncbi:MAG: hypothetical protein HC907_07295 [Richelia sp. SM1_7_0]|nr:hypothetical protein [Richelia sp. SM1_7_0]
MLLSFPESLLFLALPIFTDVPGLFTRQLWFFLPIVYRISVYRLYRKVTSTVLILIILSGFAINSLLLLLSFPLIYVFERLFGFLSDATLMELADTNQPLLRELAEKAPGTFQHSLQVANLAEEAIRKIGGIRY